MEPRRIYLDDILREVWDDETRTYTGYDENGVLVVSRPYTPAENAFVDASVLSAEVQAAEAAEREAQRALALAFAATAAEPTTGGAWVQPTGPDNAYAKGSIITHNTKTWISLTPFNVWEPGVAGWREQVSEGYPAWVQPVGAVDAYPLNAKVSHNGQNWENTGSAANVWEPGVFGWVVIP